jgi:N-succinyldiaminopimelate aminotransferase
VQNHAQRLDGLGTTIFTEMTALAERTGSINLGQGFPDSDGPRPVIDAAIAALQSGANQYAPLPGVPVLREAVLEHQRERYGLEPEDVLITFGATEAIASAVLGLCDPGDEAILFEPYYDSYGACIAFAGAYRRVVTLRPPDFGLDPEALHAAVEQAGGRARMLLWNSPHNPTGRVFTREEMEAVARVCIEHDLICVSDEVYEHLVFDGEHIPIATLPGMRGRTVSISSAGKTFSFTGWKIGWVTGTRELVTAVRTAKQFLTYVSGGPFQYAIATGLALPDSFYADLAGGLRRKRDLLGAGLKDAGFEVFWPQGTYFITTDIAGLSAAGALDFCRQLPRTCGVVAVPNSVFYDDHEAGRSQVRFAFCKREEVLAAAAERLRAAAGH